MGAARRVRASTLHRHALTVLGTLGGRSSWGTDVNASGDVVGYSDLTFNGEIHAFLWTARTGVLHDLGAFDGLGSYSRPNTKAVIWNACTPLTVLPENYGKATGITRKERVVGSSEYGGTGWLKAGSCT